MANSYEHETESDDDCEVYFLKPVNEYNIVDKIKEANKELFAQDDGGAEADVDTVERTQELMALAAATNRKVSFAANLEEYEPQSGITTQELEQKLGKETETELEEEPPPAIEAVAQPLEVIVEEETLPVTETETEPEDSPEELKETEMNCPQDTESTENTATNPEDDIEEICEEILIMDMENDRPDEIAPVSADSPGTLQRKMLKQITFDYDEEQDNKSLTNLLISDNEDDEDEGDDEGQQIGINNCEQPLDFNCNESLLEDSDTEETRALTPPTNDLDGYYDDDDEEDDKLSIIVASYLPDDEFDCDKASLTSDKCTHHSLRSRKLPFSKRFSFKRKTKPSSNVVASTNANPSCRRFLPPPEVTDLKLHYKTCCEFKNAQQKLPKYTGYLSEYGLSRNQLEDRESKLQQKQRSMLQQTLKTSEDEMRKMHDNERAFTTWLKNKMRFPINKTRNMFDVKRPFGLRKCTSVGGATLTQDSGGNHGRIPNTTRYRSISAKFKKV